MAQRKLNMVRFSVTAPEYVKTQLEKLAQQNDHSLALEAGRLLEAVLRERGLLDVPPAERAPSH